MAYKILFAVVAGCLVLQASTNVVTKTSLKADNNFNVIANIINSVLEVAVRIAKEIKYNSAAINVGMHELVLQEIHPVYELVANDIESLIENATNDKVIACLKVEKDKLAGFVDDAVEEATECVMPHFNTIPDQMDPIVAGLQDLAQQAFELADTWANCKNSTELCELAFCLNTFRMLADIPNSKLGQATKAVWVAEVHITHCLNNKINDMTGELQSLYEEAAECENTFN